MFTRFSILFTLLSFAAASNSSAICSWGGKNASVLVHADCNSGDSETIQVPGRNTIALTFYYQPPTNSGYRNQTQFEAKVDAFGAKSFGRPTEEWGSNNDDLSNEGSDSAALSSDGSNSAGSSEDGHNASSHEPYFFSNSRRLRSSYDDFYEGYSDSDDEGYDGASSGYDEEYDGGRWQPHRNQDFHPNHEATRGGDELLKRFNFQAAFSNGTALRQDITLPNTPKRLEFSLIDKDSNKPLCKTTLTCFNS
ncbi:hypothetical protein THRCLA_20948 [Thraustotheca clavata]|uniref:Secreted protein n=1 Tax=Thraustotheca clavata TaxID=74557 RepID=A0A1W0A1L5_9STRA|nr:hypothetical protein THRCLA_20948 [Thraustotheca clavata]